MEINYILLGQRVKAMRQKKGMSQLLLSEKINRSAPYVSYIENGVKSMSLETLVLIANALNVSADDLLVDNLENTIKVTNHGFADIISDCNEYEMRVLLDIAKASKKALRQNR